MYVSLKIYENSECITALFINQKRWFVKISVFSAIVLVAMYEFWHALEVSRFNQMLLNFFSLNTLKLKLWFTFDIYPTLSIVGWFLYWVNTFRAGSLTYSAILKYLAIFEKKVLKFVQYHCHDSRFRHFQ